MGDDARIDNSAQFFSYEDEDSRLSAVSHASNKSVTKVSLKTAMREAEREKRKMSINLVRAKMLIDVAKLSTEVKDEIDKMFSDISDESAFASDEKYSFHAMKSNVPDTIRWTRMSGDRLIKCRLGSEVTSYEPFALVMLSRETFLQLILQSCDGIDFDHLGKYMKHLQRDIIEKDHCPDDTRLIVVLIDLEKLYTKAQNQIRKAGKDCQVTLWVDSAIAYLIYECNVEVIQHKKPVEFAEYLHTLCRIIDRFEGEELITELDFVDKESKAKPDDSLSGMDLEKFELKQNWSAMLQTISGISAKKAQALVANREFSSLKRTFDVLNDSSVPAAQRMCLLQSSFGLSSKGRAKNESVLAKKVYHAMTTGNGRIKIGMESG